MPLIGDHIDIPSSSQWIYLKYGNGVIIDKKLLNEYKINDLESFLNSINLIAKVDVEKLSFSMFDGTKEKKI